MAPGGRTHKGGDSSEDSALLAPRPRQPPLIHIDNLPPVKGFIGEGRLQGWPLLPALGLEGPNKASAELQTPEAIPGHVQIMRGVCQERNRSGREASLASATVSPLICCSVRGAAVSCV